jgi:hypothetical protein
MRSRAGVGTLLSLILWSGCRAHVGAPPDGGPGDGAVADDLGGTDGVDGQGVDACASGPTEICGNGCDDDRNGYIDDDDPACTAQLLGTVPSASEGLYRFLLGPSPSARKLDSNAVPGGGFAEYDKSFADAVFIAFEAASKYLRKLTLAAGGTGAFVDNPTSYGVRDACVFNGELIVTDTAGHKLHRLGADGKTESGSVSLDAAYLISACASDGTYLYVAEHDQVGSPSRFEIFDKTFARVGAPIDLWASVQNLGFDRCLDFAWVKRGGFYGLFVASGSELNDGKLSATEIVPFAFDGGVGTPVPVPLDGGTLHGLGAFQP